MRAISRFVYLLAGLAALYMAIAPALTGSPASWPHWITIAFWCAAIPMIAAAAETRAFGDRPAVIGSSIIIAIYGYFAMAPILLRLGYYHLEYRLVSVREFPRWRYELDKPVLLLLLLTALISLGLSIQSIVASRNHKPPRDASSG
jgi:hypothetical protein